MTIGRWVAKLVAHLLATAALWIRIQKSLKNTKWATLTKEWPTHYGPPKNIQKIDCNENEVGREGDYIVRHTSISRVPELEPVS